MGPSGWSCSDPQPAPTPRGGLGEPTAVSQLRKSRVPTEGWGDMNCPHWTLQSQQSHFLGTPFAVRRAEAHGDPGQAGVPGGAGRQTRSPPTHLLTSLSTYVHRTLGPQADWPGCCNAGIPISDRHSFSMDSVLPCLQAVTAHSGSEAGYPQKLCSEQPQASRLGAAVPGAGRRLARGRQTPVPSLCTKSCFLVHITLA